MMLSSPQKLAAMMLTNKRVSTTLLTRKSGTAFSSLMARNLSSQNLMTTTTTATRPMSTATTAAASSSSNTFPSLVISKDGLQAMGAFAESQALYLNPDPAAVQDIVRLCRATKTGIVAHYYMDVELQGVLQQVANGASVGIADSLKMGDLAAQMVQNDDCRNIVCLGVDFMSESVQAVVKASSSSNGANVVPVYRADARAIGCSLAEAAERDVYHAWLHKHSQNSNALHVIYINTSLATKAASSTIVPTITCTSSNVLATLLQASAQMGSNNNSNNNNNLKILYGPDTYMGDNLVTYLDTILQSSSSSSSGDYWTDDRIKTELHAQHSRASLQRLRDSIVVFPQGNCVVHHMFGASVVQTVMDEYMHDSDCFVTAHLEVPGEMFSIAMQKSLKDEGVVGSTSNILQFIQRKVQQAGAASSNNSSTTRRLRFILGTEAGMITSIVSSVKEILKQNTNGNIEAEIIFPVAPDAYTATAANDSDLAIVPGVSGSEGCSTAGGCATCPFMKMNSLDSLIDLLELIELAQSGDTAAQQKLKAHLPPDRLSGKMLNGRPALQVGTESIMYMREFMQTQELPIELCQKVMKNHFDRDLLYRA